MLNPLRCKGEELEPIDVVELQVFVMSLGIPGWVDGIVIDITSSMPKSAPAMKIKSSRKIIRECKYNITANIFIFYRILFIVCCSNAS